MRVAFAIHTYAPVRGGCETLVAGLARGLLGRGHEVRVFTSNATSIEGFVDPRRPRLPSGSSVVDGVDVVRLRYFAGPRWLRRVGDIVKELWHRRQLPGFGTVKIHWFGPHLRGLSEALSRFDPDVVVATALPFLHVVRAARWARRQRRPVVVLPAIHPHDAWAFHNPRLESLLRDADGVVALTEAERDYLIAAGVEREKIVVLGVGVDEPPSPAPGRDAAKIALGLSSADSLILFLGRKEPGKGIERLVSAHRILSDRGVRVELAIAGPETAWSRNALPRLVSDSRTRAPLLLDEVDDERKEQLLAAADVVALPSRLDSFGIVFLEAWIRGRPVVGAWTATTSRLISDGVDGLLAAPDDPADMARVLGLLLEDPARAADYGAAGRQKASTLYSWNALTLRFEERLKSLGQGPPTATAPAVRAGVSTAPRVSVVIVARDGGEDLASAVESAWTSTRPADEVVVVDNASTDAAATWVLQRFPETRLVELPFNSGFAEGNNRGIRLATGDLVLLLNQDAVLRPEAIARLLDAVDSNPRAGAFALKVLVREEPRVLQSAGLVANQLLYACDRGYLDLDGAEWATTDRVLGGTGAALALRRAALDQVGEFDRSLFMYYEDLDLCLRMRLAGWEVLYVADAVALHRQKKAARQIRYDELVDHRNRLRVAWKTLPLGTLTRMAPREALFQSRCLLRFARARDFRRLRLRVGGLLQAGWFAPSTIAARRRLLVTGPDQRRRLVAMLEPGWGYPEHAPPTPALGEAQPAEGSLDFSPEGAAAFSLGWWGPEFEAGEGWFRWTGGHAFAYLRRPEGATTISLRVKSLVPQELEIRLGARRISRVSLAGSRWEDCRLEMSPRDTGDGECLLLVSQHPTRPVDAGLGIDRRLLGVAVTRLCWL